MRRRWPIVAALALGCATPARVVVQDDRFDAATLDGGYADVDDVTADLAPDAPSDVVEEAACRGDFDCSLPNASSRCEGGRCVVARCESDHADCNQEADDGCEARLPTDERHCGGCAVACSAREVCVTGQCDRVDGLALGRAHSCALLGRTGRVLCWGRNDQGQLGAGDTTLAARDTPAVVAGLAGVAQIAAGRDATCALRTTGEVYCWGSNRNARGAVGRLGVERTEVRVDAPTRVVGLQDVLTIAVGDDIQCALTRNARAWCWGGTGLHAIGVRADNETYPNFVDHATQVEGGLEFTTLSVGSNHVCGLRPNGAVRCWGANGVGQLGVGGTMDRRSPSTSSDAVATGATAVVAGGRLGCAVVQGAVSCWGALDDFRLRETIAATPTTLVGTEGWRGLGLAYRFGCGQLVDGRASCFGDNDFGQLGRGRSSQRPEAPGTPVVDFVGPTLGVGWFHACGVDAMGAVRCWGEPGALGNGTTAAQLVPGAVADLP